MGNKDELNKFIPNSIDKAINNLIDKPTTEIGNSISDIWTLIFGKVNFLATKRKMTYAYELEQFKEELNQKIKNIPNNEYVCPQTRIVAKALESVKFSVEDKDIRELFSNLISRSMMQSTKNLAYPIYIEIINQLSSLDARLFKFIFDYSLDTVTINDFNKYILEDERNFDLSVNFSILESLGLICSKYGGTKGSLNKITNKGSDFYAEGLYSDIVNSYLYHTPTTFGIFDSINLTTLGIGFAEACL